MKSCSIFYVSDGTGITAETVGQSLMSQFRSIRFIQKRIPFVDSVERAEQAAQLIRGAKGDYQPLVINTVVDIELRRIIHAAGGVKLDPFNRLLVIIEETLGIQRDPAVGRAHGITDMHRYDARINAMNYALSHDDGMRLRYDDADLILLGVSRSGKTPTCLYLALHYGILAANYPITPEDLERGRLPDHVLQHKDKAFGLSIDPFRLSQIRAERRPNSQYANLRNCQREVTEAESMYQRSGISFLNTTHTSIEEISGKILMQMNLNKELI